MTYNTIAVRTFFPSFQSMVATTLLFCLLTVSAHAQTSSSNTDGTTPLALSPGAPAGSYALGGFDNINPYNGGLNFRLPLLKIGGRGSASYTMTLPIEQHWRVESFKYGQQTTYNAVFNWWTSIRPGYGPGVLVGRSVGRLGPTDCPAEYDSMLTRFTFTTPEGTEYELRDQLYDGAPSGNRPSNSPCEGTSLDRGRVFKTSDGTAVTFIADVAVVDDNSGTILDNGESIITAAGNLYMPDGTLYRINSSGLVEYIRDRNGNELTFGYDIYSRVTLITDSLNRAVTVCYASTASCGNNSYDLITYNGSGSTLRYIRVYYDGDYSNILRNTQPGDYPPPYPLFPELNGAPTGSFRMPSSVQLPDGRSYQFQYSAYGELARVVLPTGGAYEYDYQAGANGGPTSGIVTPTGYQIYRRVVTKRVYRDTSSSSLESRVTFSKPETCTSGLYCSSASTSGYVTVNHYDVSAPTPLASETHYYYGMPFDSFKKKPWDYPSWQDGKEYQTEAGASVLRREVNNWKQRAAVTWYSTDPTNPGAPPQDPRIVETTTTLYDVSPNLVAKRTSINPTPGADFGRVMIDDYNNPVDVWEYDYGPGAPPTYATRHTHIDYLGNTGFVTNPVNGAVYDNPPPLNLSLTIVHLRSLPVQQIIYSVNPTTGVETWAAQTKYEYDRYDMTLNHADFTAYSNFTGPTGSSMPGVPCSGLATCPASYRTRGNVTQVDRWLNSGGSSFVSTYTQYDIAGNVVKTIDANGNATNLDFSDRFGVPDGDARGNTIPAGFGSLMSYAFPTLITNALGHTVYTQYDYYLGKPVDTEDANGVKSSFYYENTPNTLDRPIKAVRAVGITDTQSQTSFSYNDGGHLITTTSDLDNNRLLKSELSYDGLGRTVETRTYAPGPAGCTSPCYSLVKRAYDALGRVSQVSTPYWRHETPVWTTTQYDALSRVTSVQTPDSATVTTAYNGARVLVTDQAGKQRISETDALGRLINVWEIKPADPNTVSVSFPSSAVTAGYLTSYSYDALGNLLRVAQGAQRRWFAYDSLSRLLRARNPEQGTYAFTTQEPTVTVEIEPNNTETNNTWSMAYSYDNNGNLLTKTDARGSSYSISYSYDALNRNTTVDYANTIIGSPNVPDITREYDNPDSQAKGKGRFWRDYAGGKEQNGTQYGVTVESRRVDGYDALGRPLSVTQRFKVNGVWSTMEFTTTQTYDLAGHVLSKTYPVQAQPPFQGHTVIYSYDAAGNLSSFSGNLGRNLNSNLPPQRTYASGLLYNARGQMIREKFVTDTLINNVPLELYHRRHYNARGQLFDVRLGTDSNAVYDDPNPTLWTGTTSYNRGLLRMYYSSNYVDYNGAVVALSNNNGNLYRQDVFVPSTLDGSGNVATWALSEDYYSYDELNRLKQMDELPTMSWGRMPQAFSQKFNYDRFGNRTPNLVTTWGIGLNRQAFTADTTSNRLDRPGGSTCSGTKSGLCYDAAGNLIFDNYSVVGGDRFYDAENRMTSAAGNGGTSTYVYDADGRRTRRTLQSATYWQVYGVEGELVAEYYASGTSLQKEYGYRNGQLLVVVNATNACQWLVTDQVGTPRMLVDQTGSLSGMKRHDYLPFGEELLAGMGHRQMTDGYDAAVAMGPGPEPRQQFVGYERDSETGLDYAGARYFASVQGRFTSVDPLLSTGKPWDPQSWNRYSYGLNNPLFFTDPTGMFVFATNVSSEDRERLIDAWERLRQSLNNYEKGSKAYNTIKRSLDRIGAPGQANGVTVNVGRTSRPEANAETNVSKIDKGQVTITFNRDKFNDLGESKLAGTFGHEGIHADDAYQLFSSSKSKTDFIAKWNSNDDWYRSEANAFFVTANVHAALNPSIPYLIKGEIPIPGQRSGLPVSTEFWNPSWEKLDRAQIEANQSFAIELLLTTPKRGNYGANGYGLKRPKQ